MLLIRLLSFIEIYHQGHHHQQQQQQHHHYHHYHHHHHQLQQHQQQHYFHHYHLNHHRLLVRHRRLPAFDHTPHLFLSYLPLFLPSFSCRFSFTPYPTLLNTFTPSPTPRLAHSTTSSDWIPTPTEVGAVETVDPAAEQVEGRVGEAVASQISQNPSRQPSSRLWTLPRASPGLCCSTRTIRSHCSRSVQQGGQRSKHRGHVGQTLIGYLTSRSLSIIIGYLTSRSLSIIIGYLTSRSLSIIIVSLG